MWPVASKVTKNVQKYSIISQVMSYLTKFDDVIKSGFWVIPNIKFTNLCKPIHEIINYSTSICPFESEKCGKEGKNIQKFEYLEHEKNFFNEIKIKYFI